MPKQEFKLLLREDVITGFSFSFTSALLKKLKELEKENRIFVASDMPDNCKHALIPIAFSIMHYLVEQTMYESGVTQNIEKKYPKDLIAHVEEFLAIFVEK